MSTVLDDLRKVDLSYLSKEEAHEFAVLLEELEKRDNQEKSAASFHDFV